MCIVSNSKPNSLCFLPHPLQEVQDENTPQLVYKSTRPHKPSRRYLASNYILLIDEGEPDSFQEACKVNIAKNGVIFWEEMVRTTFYLINRSPTPTLKGGIPREVWMVKR